MQEPYTIPDELWDAIRSKLDEWSEDELAKAIASDRFSAVYQEAFDAANAAFEAEKLRLAELSHEELVDLAFGLVRQHRTVALHVDRGGYNCVYLDDDE